MAKPQKKQRSDAKGLVRVSVSLEGTDGQRVKGNVVRSFKVSAATVSSVANALETVFDRVEAYSLKQ